MSFQINCPHCNRVLNVTEKAYGKELPCPGCRMLITVSATVSASPPQPPEWLVPDKGAPSSTALGRPARRPRAMPTWIGWSVAGGLAAISAIVGGAVMMFQDKPPGPAASRELASHEAGKSSGATAVLHDHVDEGPSKPIASGSGKATVAAPERDGQPTQKEDHDRNDPLVAKEANDLRDKLGRQQVENLEAQSRIAVTARDFDRAVELLQKAVELRPDDSRLQALLDTASIEQHRGKAEKQIAANDLSGACMEVLDAREILEGLPTAQKPDAQARLANDQSGNLRKSVDALAETLVAELRGKAKGLTERRQYDDARTAARLGLQLSTKDQGFLDRLKEIEQLEADPKTANISGSWNLPSGARFELTDNGNETIACKVLQLPQGVLACVGAWTRKDDRLAGQFRVVYATAPQQQTEGTVTATIKDSQTLAVAWQDVNWLSRPKNGVWTWRGKGEGLWTKAESLKRAAPELTGLKSPPLGGPQPPEQSPARPADTAKGK